MTTTAAWQRRLTHLILAVGLGIAVLAAGCGGSSDPPARAATSADPPARTAQVDLPAGRIAFRRYLDDAQTQGAIFIMRSDGSGKRQLTDPQGGATDDYPTGPLRPSAPPRSSSCGKRSGAATSHSNGSPRAQSAGDGPADGRLSRGSQPTVRLAQVAAVF
jgi:hypothetical protein